MNILIVDDHAVVREGLKLMLKRAFPSASFGEATDAAGTIDALRTNGWQVVLLDLNLQGILRIDLISEIKRLAPAVAILVLSMHAESEYGVPALLAGAQGFLNKEADPSEMVKAVQVVMSGKRFASSELTEQLLTQLASPKRAQLEGPQLSERERTVMQLLCKGTQMKEIAAQLGISPKTASTYRLRLLNKLKVSSNAELVQLALKKGWVA